LSVPDSWQLRCHLVRHCGTAAVDTVSWRTFMCARGSRRVLFCSLVSSDPYCVTQV